MFKTRIYSIFISCFIAILCQGPAHAESVFKLLSDALNSNISKPLKIQKLEKVLEYTKMTNKIIGDKEVKILIKKAPLVTKDLRVLVLRIMNNSKNIQVLEHYGKYLKSGEELIYKFYMVSSMKSLKIDIDPDNEAEFERYKKADELLSSQLIALLSHKNPNMRYVTITLIGVRNIKNAIAKLISMFATEVDQLNQEISKALVELNAKEELEKAKKSENEQIKKWAKVSFDNLVNGKKEAFAHLKSRSLIQEFTFINLQSEDEQIKKDIERYSKLLEKNESLIDATIEIGNFGFIHLPKNVKLDAKHATLCENAHKAFFLYPKHLTNHYNHSKLKEKYLACRTFIGKKMHAKAKFYLSKSQRRRNSNSPKSAIGVLSKILLNYKGLGLDLEASIDLAHGYFYDQRPEESKNLINEIYKIHRDFLTKKQKKIINKLLRKL